MAYVSIVRCEKYILEQVIKSVQKCLDHAEIKISNADRVLVKPNLLLPKLLACAHPYVVYATCLWLKDKNAKISVYDSPGFGSAARVAKIIGLTEMLKKLDISVISNNHSIKINIGNGRIINFAKSALEQDVIFSVAKLKAHSQMRMTLSIKNCFGCVTGVKKAICHYRFGNSHEEFAKLIIDIWKTLPHVVGIVDGIQGMNKTGPSKGMPINLGFLAASENLAVLDKVILDILKIDPDSVPLTHCTKLLWDKENINFPLLGPEDFEINSFIAPATLQSASFKPERLLKSLLKRIFAKYLLNVS